MSYFFSGSVELTADDKNRFRFPTKYKDCYLAEDIAGNAVYEEVYVLKTLNCNYLTVFPKNVAEKFIGDLQKNLFLKETRETKIAKYYISQMESSKVDSQGRFVISAKQKGSLNIGKDIVMLGAGDKIEIWNKAEYEKYNAELENELFESISNDSDRTDIDNIVIGLD